MLHVWHTLEWVGNTLIFLVAGCIIGRSDTLQLHYNTLTIGRLHRRQVPRTYYIFQNTASPLTFLPGTATLLNCL